MLCSSNGKLELKKNAATGYWGSVNRIASLSRHQSFLATAPLSAAIAAANSGSTSSTQGGERTRRMTRQDAARKYVGLVNSSSGLSVVFNIVVAIHQSAGVRQSLS